MEAAGIRNYSSVPFLPFLPFHTCVTISELDCVGEVLVLQSGRCHCEARFLDAWLMVTVTNNGALSEAIMDLLSKHTAKESASPPQSSNSCSAVTGVQPLRHGSLFKDLAKNPSSPPLVMLF